MLFLFISYRVFCNNEFSTFFPDERRSSTSLPPRCIFFGRKEDPRKETSSQSMSDMTRYTISHGCKQRFDFYRGPNCKTAERGRAGASISRLTSRGPIRAVSFLCRFVKLSRHRRTERDDKRDRDRNPRWRAGVSRGQSSQT